MKQDPVIEKALEALKATGGDKLDAQKLLITWALRNHDLLVDFVRPHMKAIAASIIDRASRTKQVDGMENKPVELSDHARTVIDDLVTAAVKHVPYEKQRNVIVPPPKETTRQANAMRRVAEAFSEKKKKD